MNDLNSSEHQILVAGKPFQKAFFFKYFAGKYWYITAWLIPFLICFLIPWEYLYHQTWYQAYIEFAASFLPVLTNIESSEIVFKEYAIAFLAFVNVVGLSLSTFVFVYGCVGINIPIQNNVLGWSFKTILIKFLPVTLFMTFAVMYCITTWDGAIPNKFPQTPLLRKDVFVITAILLWWATVIEFFFLPFILKITYLKLKFKNIKKTK